MVKKRLSKSTSKSLRPPLKWAGGKRWLVPILHPNWAPLAHKRLVEPFCGGLAIALGLNPQQALLNDLNPHLINFYRWLQHGLHSDLTSADHDATVYYRNRDRFNALITAHQHHTQEAALLFYYLNRTGFNGLCRFNAKGYYNVPFGQHNRINYMTTPDFAAYRHILQRWQFTNTHFRDLPLHPDDFIYADPPYDVQFTQYAPQSFRWQEQIELAAWLADHPGPVVLSNQATERIVDLYTQHHFTLHYYPAPRRISRTGDRTPAREVIAVRNLAWQPPP